jgi:transcriptional regulator
MYIPQHFREEEPRKLIEFMREYNFATIISSENEKAIATHLPFLIQEEGDELYLISHMARANPQWSSFERAEALIIFQGPHSYISPAMYESKKNVPTWNYIAVHARGKAEVIHDAEKLRQLLESSIDTFETGFMSQWKELPEKYVNDMLRAIVGIRIRVTELEGKFKLSQNKTEKEKQNIITDLSASADPEKQKLAEHMKKQK